MPSSASYMDELPDGWVRQFDESTDHPFWVDTNAKPPRAIWVHPYEDEAFLSEHPEIRDRLAKTSHLSPDDAPPAYTPRRHSYSGPSGSGSGSSIRDSVSQPGTPAGPRANGSASTSDAQKHRGFFGKIKDKAIGTKEELEEAKRQEALYMQRRAEQRRKAIEEMRRQQRLQASMAPPPGPGGYYSSGYGQPQYVQTGYYGGPSRGTYYAPPPGQPRYYESYDRYGRRGYNSGGFGGGGGNLALPLLGGLAGGLLLGDLLGGGIF